MPKSTAADDSGGEKQRNDEMYIAKLIGDINIKEKMFNLTDIKDRIGEKGPYQNVFLQECEYMNYLIEEINRSLVELQSTFSRIFIDCQLIVIYLCIFSTSSFSIADDMQLIVYNKV